MKLGIKSVKQFVEKKKMMVFEGDLIEYGLVRFRKM
jgi:hypothetical protein